MLNMKHIHVQKLLKIKIWISEMPHNQGQRGERRESTLESRSLIVPYIPYSVPPPPSK